MSERMAALASRSDPKSLLYRLHIDVPLLVMISALIVVGLIVLYSASGNTLHVHRQAIRVGIAYVGMITLAQFDPRMIRFWSVPVYIAGVTFLVMVAFVGIGAMGATRWLGVSGVFMFQPAEIMKLAAPAMLAWFLTRYELPPRMGHVAIALFLCLAPAVLVINQPDLGTALLIICSGLFVIFLAGLSWWYILAGLGAAVAIFPLAWLFVLRDYQKQRILTLFDPHADPLGSGWNIIQSQTAIGSGGWDGKGYLEGTQSQ
ncbi:MAG: FtsW/RodA/SpoVE family cell cycle protein, partial [Natronospirillum sp.]